MEREFFVFKWFYGKYHVFVSGFRKLEFRWERLLFRVLKEATSAPKLNERSLKRMSLELYISRDLCLGSRLILGRANPWKGLTSRVCGLHFFQFCRYLILNISTPTSSRRRYQLKSEGTHLSTMHWFGCLILIDVLSKEHV